METKSYSVTQIAWLSAKSLIWKEGGPSCWVDGEAGMVLHTASDDMLDVPLPPQHHTQVFDRCVRAEGEMLSGRS